MLNLEWRCSGPTDSQSATIWRRDLLKTLESSHRMKVSRRKMPFLAEFRLGLNLPDCDFGTVDLFAFSRLARICFDEEITNPLSKDGFSASYCGRTALQSAWQGRLSSTAGWGQSSRTQNILKK